MLPVNLQCRAFPENPTARRVIDLFELYCSRPESTSG